MRGAGQKCVEHVDVNRPGRWGFFTARQRAPCNQLPLQPVATVTTPRNCSATLAKPPRSPLIARAGNLVNCSRMIVNIGS